MITLKIAIITFGLIALSNGAAVLNKENLIDFLRADDRAPTTTKAPIYGPYPPNTNLCFPDVGCFSNKFPFNYTANYLPLHPDELQTELILFTRKNRNAEQVLSYSNMDVVKNSYFNKSLPLKFIIHGFSNNRSTEWLYTMKDAILKEENVNVVIVAWGNGALFPLYNNASTNIRLVGKQVGLFVDRVRDAILSSNPKSLNVHCIGHSLGAHTCAFSSNAAQIRFNRISGLDPAGPFFEDADPILRLDPTDADYVDAIHTNGGNVLSIAFGIVMPVGHVDFYVNGGRFQPGCPGLTSIIGGIFTGSADPTKDVGCSHNRVLQFFTESISSSCPFMGFNCNSEDSFERGECTSCTDNKCSVMGYHAQNYKGRGSMYLKTNPAKPYCGYHHMFELKINPNSPKSAGELLISVEEATNNSPKAITRTSDDINPGDTIKRMFVTEHDLVTIGSINLGFNKKSKPFFGSDPNSVKFLFDKVKVTNVEIDEIYTKCQPGMELNDKETITINLKENDC